MVIEPFNFKGVIEEVAFDDVVIGEVGGYFNIFDFFARPHTFAFFVFAMGFVTAVPEAEGCVFGAGFEKVGKVGGVVLFVDGAGRWGKGVAVVIWSGGIVFKLAVITRSPSFAGVANVVSCFGQKVGIDGEFGGEEAKVIAGFFELPGVHSG